MHAATAFHPHEVSRIREDFHSGVNGAPSFFINVARYDGVVEVQELLAALTGEPG